MMYTVVCENNNLTKNTYCNMKFVLNALNAIHAEDTMQQIKGLPELHLPTAADV